METAESLIAYCRENGRVCPQPRRWNELWEILPNRRRIGDGWEPALPMILSGWWVTPAFAKQLRLAEHIKWADENNCLDQVATFLRNLKEVDWYHLGE